MSKFIHVLFEVEVISVPYIFKEGWCIVAVSSLCLKGLNYSFLVRHLILDKWYILILNLHNFLPIMTNGQETISTSFLCYFLLLQAICPLSESN